MRYLLNAAPGGVEWPSAGVHEAADAVLLRRRRLLPVGRMRVAVIVLVLLIVAVLVTVTTALVVQVVLPAAVLVVMPLLCHHGPLCLARPVTVRVAVGVLVAVRGLVAVAVMVSSGAVVVFVASAVRMWRVLRGTRGRHGTAVLPLYVQVGDQGAGPAAEDLRQVHAALLARDHLHQTANFRGTQDAAVLVISRPLRQSVSMHTQADQHLIDQELGSLSRRSEECSAVKLCACEARSASGVCQIPSKHAPSPGGSGT